MLHREPSVPSIPSGRFKPPHCAFAECPAHRHPDPATYRCRRAGWFTRKCDDRAVQRFRCSTCTRRFSQQSFANTYYMKRPELLRPIAAALVACSAHRQIARSFGCAPSSVTRLAARLGRIAMLLHVELLAGFEQLADPVVFDHFETFVGCQEDALGLGTAFDQRSRFWYLVDPAPFKRTIRGRRPRRRSAGHPSRQRAFRESAARSVRLLFEFAPKTQRLRLVSDRHGAYAVAFRRHGERIEHRAYANPRRRSKGLPRGAAAHERDREMWPVDQAHGMIRHTLAREKRETLAFGRRTNASAERGWLMLVWWNVVKGVSERRGDRTTPAMRLELTDAPWSIEEVLARRRFPGRMTVPEPLLAIYRREWITPTAGRNLRHELRRAF